MTTLPEGCNATKYLCKQRTQITNISVRCSVAPKIKIISTQHDQNNAHHPKFCLEPTQPMQAIQKNEIVNHQTMHAIKTIEIVTSKLWRRVTTSLPLSLSFPSCHVFTVSDKCFSCIALLDLFSYICIVSPQLGFVLII